MSAVSDKDILGGYCYGPVDLTGMRQDEGTVYLFFKDSSGKDSCAAYEDCVYCRLGKKNQGEHFSLVQKISADKILEYRRSVYSPESDGKDSAVRNRLKEWEDSGHNFYVHIGARNTSDYLIVAKKLCYTDNY